MTEQFTAIAICPQCGTIAVHQLREPRYASKGRIAALYNSIGGAEWFDPDDAEIVRICQCGHEWAQR